MGDIAKTDAELVEASRRGEREAFGLLVTRYQDLVCAVSFSSTGNWALSEDVAQETFIAAWRQLGQLREVGRLRSWLCGIARNLARKARRRGDRADSTHVEACDDVAAPDANPFDATAQAEVDRVVREALARVPDTYRETLVLYYCENRSVREVSEALGIAEAAAMQRLTRGRRYLADGVHTLVERSLRGPKRSKNLATGVLAALPPLTVPSRVDASPKPEGSTMLKIGIAAAIVAAVGTGGALAVRQMQTDAPTTTTTQSATAPKTVEAAVAQAVARTAPALPPRGAPSIVQRGDMDDGEEARVIPKETITRLGLDRGPSRGPANAPVTIIVFQDLMCKYCTISLGTIDQLFEEYPGKLRLVVKQLPVHEEARLAAEASLAADAQGKFWELHDIMMANEHDLTRDAILGYARQAGMDVGKLADALDRHTYADALAKEMAAAKEIGVHAVPEFLINGEDVQGLRPVETFRAAIDKALAAL